MATHGSATFVLTHLDCGPALKKHYVEGTTHAWKLILFRGLELCNMEIVHCSSLLCGTCRYMLRASERHTIQMKRLKAQQRAEPSAVNDAEGKGGGARRRRHA